MKKIILTLNLMSIFLIIACIRTPYSVDLKTGGIYGKMFLRKVEAGLPPLNETEAFRKAKVRVESKKLTAQVDSTGIFYLPEVPPGEYIVIGTIPEFLDGIVEKVEVAADSISIVAEMGLTYPIGNRSPEKKIWRGTKIGKVDIQRKGSIIGYVYDINEASPVAKATVYVEGTSWGAYTDSSGTYRISDILPGKYTVRGMELGYHWTFIQKVRVAPDSASIVDIGLVYSVLPKSLVTSREWKTTIIKDSNKIDKNNRK